MNAYAGNPDRRRLLAAFCLLVAITALLACAPPVLAAESCPNQAIREEQRSTQLLDCRAYELVSPSEKNLNNVMDGSAVTSPDGNRVLFSLLGGDSLGSSGSQPKFLASRTDTGWTSTSAMPKRTDMLADSYAVASYTPDLSSWIASAEDGLGAADVSPDVSLLRLTDTGVQTLLHTFPVYFGPSGISVVASDDLTHVFSVVPELIDPSHQPGAGNVYDFGSGTPVLVSRMPGTGLAPTCGVVEELEFANNVPGATSQNWVSQDGSRAFFLSRGDDLPDCDDASHLYMRNTKGTPGTGDDETIAISGDPLPGDPDSSVEFLQATREGSQAFFRTATSLDPRDDTDLSSADMDIYRWSEADGVVCVTCVSPNANVLTGFTAAAVAQDGSRVYFTSSAQLAPGAPATTDDVPNLYVVRADGSIDYLLTTDSGGVTDRPRFAGALTPDGKVLVFRSGAPQLDALTGTVNNGLPQYYRYDDGDGIGVGTFDCLSCRPGGATRQAADLLSVSNQAVGARIRIMSDDGRIVFFPTSEGIVPEDVNRARDVYEWHDGIVKLITGGLKQYPQFAQVSLLTTTASGHDVFFRDNAKLTSQVQDSAFQIFDARVDGGFEPAATPAPPCVEEQCRPLPTQEPDLSSLASVTLEGAGNVHPAPAPSFDLGRIKATQRRHLARTGEIALAVRVSGAGRVSAFAQARLDDGLRKVAHGSKVARRAGTVTLRLRLSRAARAQLASGGTLKLVLAVHFSKVPESERLVLKLKATANGR